MAAQPLGLRRRLAAAWDIWRLYRQGALGSPSAEIELHTELVDLLHRTTGLAPAQARILEIGCGQMARQTALFAADGAHVTGIDLEVPTYRLTPAVLWAVLRHNGLERALKSLARSLLFDRPYRRALAHRYPRPIPYHRLDTRWMDAGALGFPANTFDFIFSVWVFEHVEDVPRAVQEFNRVLKPGGAAVIRIHLFPSLSGGHDLTWNAPDQAPSPRTPPWDHLRRNQYPANFYLNQLRLAGYRRIFAAATRVEEEQLLEEGHACLTPELWQELSARGYTRVDLLTRAATLVCRKL